MAQVDVRWPSEDEDFDAVHESAQSRSRKAVAVVEEKPTDNDFSASESQNEQSEGAPEATSTETETTDPIEEPAEADVPAETPDSDTPVSVAEEPEAVEAPEPEPETAPVSEEPVGVTPVQTSNVNKPNYARLVAEVFLVAALIGVGLWAWTLTGKNNDLTKQNAQLNANPQLLVQKQTAELIDKVGRLIQLPANETPTIANVSDATQAKKQSAFFNDAQNGDKVLMYVKSGQAILYRPSTDKIILVAPLTFNSTSPASSSTSSSATKTTTTPTTTKTKTTP